MLPVTTAPSRAAIARSHSTDGPFAGSAAFSGAIVKPVVNISGSTTTSVLPASGVSNRSMALRLAAASCQTRSVCTRVTRKVSRLIDPPSDPAQPFGCFFERRIILRETEAQHRELRCIRVERRDRYRGDARLAQQRVGEFDVALLRDRAEVEQLEIGTGRGRPAEAGVAQAVEEPV